jgi:hypothetical protein
VRTGERGEVWLFQGENPLWAGFLGSIESENPGFELLAISMAVVFLDPIVGGIAGGASERVSRGRE